MYIYNLTKDEYFSGDGTTTYPHRTVKYVLVKETYTSHAEFIRDILPKYRGIPILIDLDLAKAMLVKRIPVAPECCWVVSYQTTTPVVTKYDLSNTIPDDSVFGVSLIQNPIIARDRLVREFLDTYMAYISTNEANTCKLYIHANLTPGILADLVVSTNAKVAYFKEVLKACKVKI